jgi:hypothetical protein
MQAAPAYSIIERVDQMAATSVASSVTKSSQAPNSPPRLGAAGTSSSSSSSLLQKQSSSKSLSSRKLSLVLNLPTSSLDDDYAPQSPTIASSSRSLLEDRPVTTSGAGSAGTGDVMMQLVHELVEMKILLEADLITNTSFQLKNLKKRRDDDDATRLRYKVLQLVEEVNYCLF